MKTYLLQRHSHPDDHVYIEAEKVRWDETRCETYPESYEQEEWADIRNE